MKRCVNEQRSNDFIWKASKARGQWASVLKKHFTPFRTQDIFIPTGEVGVDGGGKHLDVRILCSYSCPGRSGHNAPINFQESECYSFVLLIFISF